MKYWYRFLNMDDPEVAEIHIIDFIGDWIDDYFGFGVTAKQFIDELAALPESVQTIRVHINSPGGDVFGAMNIANALRDQRATKDRKVETIVDGLAASAATIVMMAGDPIRISDNALVMIHNPWSITLGDAADLRKDADNLDTIRDTIVATYQWHVELSDEELIALMDAETWMDADVAVERGFATEKVEGLRAAASIDPRVMAKLKLKVPDRYEDRVQAFLAEPDPPAATGAPAPAPKPKPGPVAEPAAAAEVIRLCGEAECLDLAEELVSAEASLEAVQGRLAAEKKKRTAAASREREIHALCTSRGLDELADGYVSGGMPLDTVRTQLTAIAARLDQAEIDTGLPPDGAPRGKSVIDVTNVYRELNQLPAAKE